MLEPSGARYFRARDVRIDVDSPAGPGTVDDGALAKIFLSPGESVFSVAPDCWGGLHGEVEDWLMSNEHSKPRSAIQHEYESVAYKVDPTGKNGRPVTAPRGLDTPDPTYEEFARQQKFQGTVVLWAVVNTQGVLENVKIMRALGFGLDERAVEAVRNWKFEPGKRDGVSVSVQVNIELNFRLY